MILLSLLKEMDRKRSPIQYKSLSECVMDYLREEMEKGNLMPGARINEKQLCQLLGVSRTPIREAIIQLQKEGFVEILPRKSIRIKKLTLKEIEDIYNVIGILESEAAEIACEKITQEDIKKMEEMYQKMEKALKKNNFKSYMEHNRELHNIHIELSGNKILQEIITKLRSRLYDFPRMMLALPEWEEKCMKEHKELIELFKRKDKKAIRKLIRDKHWGFRDNYKFILKYYDLVNSKNNDK